MRKRDAPPPEPELNTVVGDLAVAFSLTGVFSAAGSGVIPGVLLLAEGGARLSDHFAMTVVGEANFLFLPTGNATQLSVGPGFRFGGKSHATLSPGMSLFILNTSVSSGVGISPSVAFNGATPLSGNFSMEFFSRLSFDSGGVLLQSGLGLGASFY